MAAEEMRRLIMLVEGQQYLGENDGIGRRSLFRSAAAMAAVAALPAQVRQDAARLIGEEGPDLLRVALDVVENGIDSDAFTRLDAWKEVPEETDLLDFFPGSLQDRAMMIMTGESSVEDALERMEDLRAQGLDQQVELVRRAWEGMGSMRDHPYHDQWSRIHRAYQLTKKHPDVLEPGRLAAAWDAIRDFLPDDLSGERVGGYAAGGSGIEDLRHELELANQHVRELEDAIAREGGDIPGWLKGHQAEVLAARDHLERLLRVREKTSPARVSPRKPATLEPSAGTAAKKSLSPVMRAVSTMLNALKPSVRVDDRVLRALSSLTPDSLKRDAQPRGEPTPKALPADAPAALPAPDATPAALDIGQAADRATVRPKTG